jgi:DNA processing protein
MPQFRDFDSAPIVQIKPAHSCWPQLWTEIKDPPESVHVQGQVKSLLKPSVAIVGTRRATLRGLAFARALAMVLACRGWCLVSGLALGIDAAVHRGALEGGGSTIAVMGTGLGRIYPAVHGNLRKEIESSGCCLTEYDTDEGPRKYHFPQRNRLIAGMVQGVIVVEAPLQSGALITAQMALDYNREVFAVPGPVDQETSRGCHHLLRQGAHLLETADDLFQVLGNPAGHDETASSLPPGVVGPAPGSAARWILDRLDFEGTSRDELHGRFCGSQEMWGEGLLALELAGLIRRLPGGLLARTMWRV